jgi:CheY-like chemotaxis protein
MAPVELRVLIVDDNPGDARLVEITLTKEKGFAFRCERASRVAAALERLKQGDVDAVLLDLGLPDSQGTEGLRKIRAVAPRVAIIVLSGTDNPTMAMAAVAAGAQDYLVKGIFAPGYLGNTLRLAVLLRSIEVGLEDERPIPVEALDELGRARIGAAVLAPHGVSQWNDSFSELTGYAPDAGSTTLPAWLSSLVGVVPSVDGPGSALRSGATTPTTDVGSFVLDTPQGPGPTLEFSLRRYPHTSVPRVFLAIRLAEPHRRASHRTAPRPDEPRVAADSGSALDRETWENLRELAGADTTFLPKLVSAFSAEGRRLVGGLQAAVDEADTARIGRLAHTLKSTFAQVGALDMARRCSELEAQSETGNIPETRTLILEIARGFGRVQESLAKRYPTPV